MHPALMIAVMEERDPRDREADEGRLAAALSAAAARGGPAAATPQPAVRGVRQDDCGILRLSQGRAGPLYWARSPESLGARLRDALAAVEPRA